MGLSVAQKILREHLTEGSVTPGDDLVVGIDQTLTQDATGTMAYLELEAVGVDALATELSVSYVDHNTLQEGFENADDHRFLQTVAAKYGILYSRAGNGICHQVHLERFASPGKTLLGSDSHTPTAGGMGSIAIGAGGLDVAVAMAKGTFALAAPRIIRAVLTGALSGWVSAKDVILEMLRRLTTKGNVGCLVEYAGPGVATLSVPERATITNMGAELGVTTSIFPSDGMTRAFLAAQGREEEWREIVADDDAVYDRTIEIDLAALEPLIATPHSPGNVTSVKELAGTPVDQVCVGSCTNSSLADLMTTAAMLRGKTVHEGVSLIVAPGSKQVFGMIAANGALATIIGAGARIAESACGFCIGMGQAPRTDATSLRTNNRNFQGRSGTKSANVYLVSPQVAVAAALTGAITDPRTLGKPPTVDLPETFTIDDNMIVRPPEDRSLVEVYRGPNIGPPPVSEKLGDTLCGVVTIKLGDKITTDHIMPAGSRMKYRSNIEKYAEFVFEGVDATFATRARENAAQGIGNVILAGLSYGQGSSREHAAICPMFLGVKMVVAKSIERIHRSNLINFGIVPAVFANEVDYDAIEQGDRLEGDDLCAAVAGAGEIVLRNTTKGTTVKVTCSLAQKERDVLLAGGTLNHIKTTMQGESQ
jgi:aconitate hydratase